MARENYKTLVYNIIIINKKLPLQKKEKYK